MCYNYIMVYITVNGLKYGVIKGSLLKDALLNNNLVSQEVFVCRGKGLCGKCRVSILREYDKEYTSVLSCQTEVNCNMVIKLKQNEVYYSHIDNDINKVKQLGLAVDIGTTTLSLAFYDLVSKKEKGRIIKSNPQHIYGSDVVSRIEAYTRGDNLQALIIESVSEEIMDLTIQHMIISANTVMQHIFAGASLNGMRTFPMEADCEFNDIVSIKGSDINLNYVNKVDIIPYVGEYFGGDALLGVIEADRINTSDKPYLLVDLGTNSEVALITKDRVYCTAAAAGCALLSGYKGSDVLYAIGELLECGEVYDTGLIISGKGNVTYSQITLTQADIRSYQLMKAAIRAGIKIICDVAKIDYNDIGDIYISGQFGSKTTIESLFKSGIIPKSQCKITIMGNSSLNGAINYLLGNITEDYINNRKSNCTYYNMAKHPEFNDIYVDEINF